MPSVQRVFEHFRNEQGFRMVTVLYRDDYQRAMAYLKESKYAFPVLLDANGATAHAYGVTGVPETYIIDKEGVLQDKIIGPADLSSPQMVSFLTQLIKQ